jgi:hypothetical protein
LLHAQVDLGIDTRGEPGVSEGVNPGERVNELLDFLGVEGLRQGARNGPGAKQQEGNPHDGRVAKKSISSHSSLLN